MLDVGQLPEFIERIIDIINDENEHKVLWETWLHKDFENTFDKFYDKHKKSAQNQNVAATDTSKSSLEATIRNSMELLNNFSG